MCLKNPIALNLFKKCPWCSGTMDLFAHHAGWKPKAGRKQYFKWWNKCLDCKKVKYENEARVVIGL